jgi:hypothetical protein
MPAHLTRPARDARMVETMRMTANSFQLTAYGLGRMRRQKHAGAVSHRPKAVPARVCECYGLTQDESAFVEGRNDRRG